MKRLAFFLTLLFAASVAIAQEPSSPIAQEPSKATAAKPMGATKELAVQVVATDPVAKTITVTLKKPAADSKDLGAAPRTTTFPVEADAVFALQTVVPGDKVKLVCRTDSAGKETAVTAIQKTDKPEAPKP